MQKIKRGKIQKYAFDNRDKPCMTVRSGEIFQIETDDALSGMISDDSDHPTVQGFASAHFARLARSTPGLFNPVVGPIYVEDCKAGDVLAIKIDWIDPWRYGFSGALPHMGPLGDSLRYKECAEGYVHVIEHLPGPSGYTRDGTAKYSDTLSWPLEPFIGTLATAPEREVLTSVLGQGPFGGNIDCRDIAPGHTVYLNAYNDGALLYVGDVHGAQGDTEFTGIADETRATVQLSCSVIKNKRLPCVRIDKGNSIVAVGINLPMEHAVYDAVRNLMQWLEEDYGVTPRDLYVRMSCDPAFRVRTYQMVRLGTLQHVVGAEYPKSRLFDALKSKAKRQVRTRRRRKLRRATSDCGATRHTAAHDRGCLKTIGRGS